MAEVVKPSLQIQSAITGQERSEIISDMYSRLIMEHDDTADSELNLIGGTGLNIISNIHTQAGPGINQSFHPVVVTIGETMKNTSYGVLPTFLYNNTGGPPYITTRTTTTFTVVLPLAAAGVEIVLGWILVWA